jgi:O-antigen biosynthesis protein WbqV
MKLPVLTSRGALIALHDLLATAVALLAAFYVRNEEIGFAARQDWLIYIVPPFIVYAGIVYAMFDLSRGKWRFASLPDLVKITAASTVLAVSLLVLDYILLSPQLYGTFFFGKITIALYWFLQMFCLGAGRIIYRYFRYTRERRSVRVSESAAALVIGRSADVDVLLRGIESGAIQKIWPVAILSPSQPDQFQAVRGIRVRGVPDHLESVVKELEEEGQRVSRVVILPSALEPSLRPEGFIMQARRLGLTVSRLPSYDGGEALRLAPVDVEDLLLRPSVKIDYGRLESFVRGKSVLVTGGGGSIGAELCDRMVAFKAARLLVLDNSEPALHAVLEKLAAREGETAVEGRIADVRDRERIFELFAEFAPDIVFHAAALKHVPILERDWGEGIKTNIFGSVNVADAAIKSGAAGMVMISTDKAIEPVSVLGATKRFAEMYCQALDGSLARAGGARGKTRLLSVRFGNVLASNGSVVPKFKAQIEAGGPVTVTHPDMVRYFMTIREACDLVVAASSHGVGPGHSNASIFVLNMGQPVKIIDLAERLIRLSGLEPGRDIEIAFTGIRPGERLKEILFAQEEPSVETGIDGVVAAQAASPTLEVVQDWVKGLGDAMAREQRTTVFSILGKAVPEFQGPAGHSQAASPAA